jgi:hypothetical protein
MAAELATPTHKIAIQLHLVAESCAICSSRSRRPVLKLLDTPSYMGMNSLVTSLFAVRLGWLLRHVPGTVWTRISSATGRLILNSLTLLLYQFVALRYWVSSHTTALSLSVSQGNIWLIKGNNFVRMGRFQSKRLFVFRKMLRCVPLNKADILLSICTSDSSVGIALGYGLDDRGSRVRFPAGDGNFSLHHHPASYPMGTRGSFPGGKAARAWSWPLISI